MKEKKKPYGGVERKEKKGEKTAAGKPSRHGTGLGMFVKNRTTAAPVLRGKEGGRAGLEIR